MVFELPPEDASGEPVRISLRDGSLTVAAGDAYVFDGSGRLVTASQEGRFYKRGLDHRVLEKQRPEDRRHAWRYRDLEGPEKDGLVAAALGLAGRVLDRLPPFAPPELLQRLAGVLSWDAAAYAGEAERYRAVYRPVGILPPDQYLSVVLQATEGCHHNRCTFCTFYRDVSFRVRDEAEFRRHVEGVRRFLGRGLSMRRSLFLGDANALVVSQRRLVPMFRVLHEHFAICPSGLSGPERRRWMQATPGGVDGVYAFVDVFNRAQKTRDDFAELAALGLRRVYVGMESGHVPLLEFLEKPSLPDDVHRAIEAAHQGGVGVGVIVMTGIGGDRYREGHERDTAHVLAGLDLTDGDLVYVSEYVPSDRSPYVDRAHEAGIRALTPAELQAQAEAFRRAVPGIRTATYAIREFIY